MHFQLMEKSNFELRQFNALNFENYKKVIINFKNLGKIFLVQIMQ